jgi:prepilin-type processing-associated H-X9-DG protein
VKPRLSIQRNHALTNADVLVVIVVLATLAAVFLQVSARSRRGGRINCSNNVKQIGLAFREWANDNGDKYPMQVSVANDGARELVAAGNAVSVFQVMSNELSNTKILICPEDKEHHFNTNFSATDFSHLNGSNVSFFVGLDASTNNPNTLLCGDDNFEIGGTPVKPGVLEISSNTAVGWTSARHTTYKRHFWDAVTSYGNIGFADGSVQVAKDSDLRNYLTRTGLATNRLAIP